ncbi:TerD family protein [Streptomyces sp. TLI_185]|uniref:TerD family protein n=1 Tax=Streptomyces sp. TLI_185 TaxID=2485151 RepID=UPI0037D9F08B
MAGVYRRGGGWKVRAVGQGYASGLSGLATDYGVDVESDQPAAPMAARPLWAGNQGWIWRRYNGRLLP